MQNLTEYQRGALVMREFGGLTYDEIGSALETTPLAARQAVFVARRRLSEGPADRAACVPPSSASSPRRPRASHLRVRRRRVAGLGAKALATTAAVVTLGVGSVEIVQHADPAPPKRGVAATKSQPRAPQRERAAKATPKAAPVESATSTPAAASPEPASTATVRFVAATRPQGETKTETVAEEPEATATPEPVATAAPTTTPPPERHRPERRPGATPPPAVASEPEPVATTAPVEHQQRPTYGSYAARQESSRICPPGSEATRDGGADRAR